MGNEKADSPFQANVSQLFFFEKVILAYENDGRSLEYAQNVLHLGSFTHKTNGNIPDRSSVRLLFRRQNAHNFIFLALQAPDQGGLQQAGVQLSGKGHPLSSGSGDGGKRLLRMEMVQPVSAADTGQTPPNQRQAGQHEVEHHAGKVYLVITWPDAGISKAHEHARQQDGSH